MMADQARDTLLAQMTLCQVCQSVVTNHRVLPCHHLFCSTCLDSKLDGDMLSVACPICKVTHLVKGVHRISDLPQNVFLLNYMKTVICDVCLKEKVETLCGLCENYVCSTCHDDLCPVKVTESEELVTKLTRETLVLLEVGSEKLRQMQQASHTLLSQTAELMAKIDRRAEQIIESVTAQQRLLRESVQSRTQKNLENLHACFTKISSEQMKLKDFLDSCGNPHSLSYRQEAIRQWDHAISTNVSADSSTSITRIEFLDGGDISANIGKLEFLERTIPHKEPYSDVSDDSASDSSSLHPNASQECDYPVPATPLSRAASVFSLFYDGDFKGSQLSLASDMAASDMTFSQQIDDDDDPVGDQSTATSTHDSNAPVCLECSIHGGKSMTCPTCSIYRHPVTLRDGQMFVSGNINKPQERRPINTECKVQRDSFVAGFPSGDKLAVCDEGKDQVQIIAMDGRRVSHFSLGGLTPGGLAVSQHDLIVITIPAQDRLMMFTETGQLMRTIKSSRCPVISSPQGVAAFQDKICVCDTSFHRVLVFRENGVFLNAFGSKIGSCFPVAVAALGEGAGTVVLYKGSPASHSPRLEMFSVKFQYIRRLTVNSWPAAELVEPRDLTVTHNGHIVVSNTGKHELIVLNSAGRVIKKLSGPPGKKLNQPTGVCAIGQRLAVVDRGNNKIRILKI